MAPIDEVVLISEVIAIDAELRWYRFRHDTVGLDSFEGFEHAGDIAVGLRFAPTVPGVAVDIIEAKRCRLLNTNGHTIRPGSGR